MCRESGAGLNREHFWVSFLFPFTSLIPSGYVAKSLDIGIVLDLERFCFLCPIDVELSCA